MKAKPETASRTVSAALAGPGWEDIPAQATFLVYHIRRGASGTSSVDIVVARDKQHASRTAALAFPDSDIVRICRHRRGGEPMYPDARFINGQFLAFLASEERTPAGAA